MRRFSIIILFGLILCLLSVTDLRATQRGLMVKTRTVDGAIKEIPLYSGYHALIIGCGNYRKGWPKLPNPVKDAREIARELKTLGWQVDLLEDPTGFKLRRTLNSLITGPGKDENKAILIWFSGHGHTLSEVAGTKLGYIVPIDAPHPNQDELGFMEEAVSMRQIETVVRRIKSKHVITLFDSCFSGAIFQAVRSAPTPYIEEKVRKPVRQFITAGSEDEQVPDKSVFKVVFLQGIKDKYADRNKDGYVTGLEIGDYLQEQVINYSRGGQHPQFGKINDPYLDKGDFVFHLAKNQTLLMPSDLDSEKQRLSVKQTMRGREDQEFGRVSKTNLIEESEKRKLEAEQKSIKVEKQEIEIAGLPPEPKLRPKTQIDSNLTSGYRKLAILPFNLRIRHKDKKAAVLLITRVLSKYMENTKAFKLYFSYYELDYKFNIKMINENVLTDQMVDDLWESKHFFSSPEPNIDLVAQIGNQLKVDAVLMFDADLDRYATQDFLNLFLIDVKQKKKFYVKGGTYRFWPLEGPIEVKRLTKEVLAKYSGDNK